MKLIKSIVRPNKVDDVKDALARMNISGMTVTEVRGHGKQKGHTAIYRGKEYNVSLLPKMEIEVVVPDSIADDAIKAIVEAARTGEIGDGRVFVFPVLESYRIRTGEKESRSDRSDRSDRSRIVRIVRIVRVVRTVRVCCGRRGRLQPAASLPNRYAAFQFFKRYRQAASIDGQFAGTRRFTSSIQLTTTLICVGGGSTSFATRKR